MDGVAVDMESPGFKTMLKAWEEVYGGEQPLLSHRLPPLRAGQFARPLPS